MAAVRYTRYRPARTGYVRQSIALILATLGAPRCVSAVARTAVPYANSRPSPTLRPFGRRLSLPVLYTLFFPFLRRGFLSIRPLRRVASFRSRLNENRVTGPPSPYPCAQLPTYRSVCTYVRTYVRTLFHDCRRFHLSSRTLARFDRYPISFSTDASCYT